MALFRRGTLEKYGVEMIGANAEAISAVKTGRYSKTS